MKHTLLITTALIITALMLVVGCSKEPINIDELVERDGIWHSKDTNKPYSGKAVEYLENGQKYYEVTFKDGKEDGKWTEWHDNGQKKSEVTYKNGEKDGLWTEWTWDGHKRIEGTFKNGEKDGLWTTYFAKGRKFSEQTFKDGNEIDYKSPFPKEKDSLDAFLQRLKDLH